VWARLDRRNVGGFDALINLRIRVRVGVGISGWWCCDADRGLDMEAIYVGIEQGPPLRW
jgi:hypothetical protein